MSVTLGVSGRADIDTRVPIAREIVETWEKLAGETPQIAPGLAEAIDRGDGTPVDEMDVDVIVPVGGDGTLLWTLMQTDEIPLLGVNDGELGYLTEIDPSEVAEGLQRVHEEDYFVESRCKLDVARDGEYLGACTNEMAVKTPRPSKILSFEIYAEDHDLEDVRADGIIVSTATGSTSYAMSAGGPLIHPALEAMLMVPLAPFRVSQRPMVLPASNALRLRLKDRGKAGVLALDGQDEYDLEPGQTLEITRSDEQARFVRFEPHFYSRIRDLFG